MKVIIIGGLADCAEMLATGRRRRRGRIMSTAITPDGDQPDAHVRQVGETTVYVCDVAGPSISSGQDAVDIIGQTWHSRR